MRYLLFLLLIGCSGAIHSENDLYGSRHHNGDQYYTNGLKFSYFPKQENENEKETYSIGQNILTPSTIYTRAELVKDTLEKDRPYGGWLYGEYRRSEIKGDKITDTLGAQIGCTGACSLARITQQEFHRQINQEVPLWDHDYTLRQEFGVILEAEREYSLRRWEYGEASVYGAGKAGNLVDSVALGIDFRAGYNIDRFASEPIIFKIPRNQSPWTAYLFVRGEERLVLYNYFLEGSMFHDDPHTVNRELSVQEFDAGFTVGYKNFKLTYRYTIFSNEWEENPHSFTFGGIDLEW